MRGPNFYTKPERFLVNTVTELSVPSGKLMVSDDLRRPEKFHIEAPVSLNYGRGCDTYARVFADLNMAYANVGNSCPTVLRRTDGRIVIANGIYNEETDEEFFDNDETVVGKVETTHWAVMLTDYQNWLDHGGAEFADENAEDGQHFVFSVTPGRYKWTVFSHADNFDFDGVGGRVDYANLELIEAY